MARHFNFINQWKQWSLSEVCKIFVNETYVISLMRVFCFQLKKIFLSLHVCESSRLFLSLQRWLEKGDINILSESRRVKQWRVRLLRQKFARTWLQTQFRPSGTWMVVNNENSFATFPRIPSHQSHMPTSRNLRQSHWYIYQRETPATVSLDNPAQNFPFLEITSDWNRGPNLAACGRSDLLLMLLQITTESGQQATSSITKKL